MGIKLTMKSKVNSTIEGKQQRPQMLMLKNNRFVICWQSPIPGTNKYRILGQLFDQNTDNIKNEFQINTLSSFPNQGNYGMSKFFGDQFIVCWEGFRIDENGLGIFAQVFDSDGNKKGDEMHINSYILNSQYQPSVICIDTSKFFVSWSSNGQDGWNDGVYGQLFDINRNRIGNEFKINDNVLNAQDNSKLLELKNNRFLVTWQSLDQNGSGDGIYGKIFLGDPVPNTLIDFELLKPESGNSNSRAIDFLWNSASKLHKNFDWEIKYDLIISRESTFKNNMIIKDIFDTTYHSQPLELDKKYYCKILARTYLGDSLWSSNIKWFYITPNATDVSEIRNKIKEVFKISQNYPNPFNPTTIINFTIPKTTFVILKVYDVLGNEIATLVNEEKTAGNYNVEFSAKGGSASSGNSDGLASGIYLCRIIAGEYVRTMKMILIK